MLFITHLFIYSIINISMWSHGHLFYSLDCIYCHKLFYYSNYSIFGHWKFFLLVHVFSETFLLSDTTKCFSLILYVSCSSPGSTSSPKKPSSFYWRGYLEIKISERWVSSLLWGYHCFQTLEYRNTCKYTN